MFAQSCLRRSAALVAGLVLLFPGSMLWAQKENDKKNHTPVPSDAKAVLWQQPSDIASRDLFLGPGGEALKPDLTKVTFISDQPGGYSKKYRVRDGQDHEWVVKIGGEAQSETAASRLVWAAGYFTDTTYLAPRVEIVGKGAFENVRFEARPKGVKRLDNWDWQSNPFAGTNELQGLKVMMLLVDNWDLKTSNNRILLVKDDDATGSGELHYIISDLGATFGKTGGFMSRSRNRPEDYAKAKFVRGVKGNFVQFDYHGKQSEIVRDITVAQAKWLGNVLSQLSDSQIADAFRAASYSPEDIETMTRIVKSRIAELVNLPG